MNESNIEVAELTPSYGRYFFLNNMLCNSVDSNNKLSHFIGQFNILYNNFVYL